VEIGNARPSGRETRQVQLTTSFLSAAQPQPKDGGETNAFVSSLALCRAALKGATSSPTGEMRFGSAVEQFEGKDHEGSAGLRFPRGLSIRRVITLCARHSIDLSGYRVMFHRYAQLLMTLCIILYSKGRTVVTALLPAREAETDKLSKLAV